MTKYEALHKLKDDMEKDDSLPLKKGAGKLVFGSGNTEAKILLCGEGPGRQEDLQGLPFVGQAGKLLDKLLLLAGLERKEVFVTNVVHHRPPENRDPLPEEITSYGKYLDQIINILNPKVIITLGRFSMAKFLPNVFISQVHGKKHDIIWKDKKIIVFPMYHPAASLRNGNILRQEQKDFLQLKDTLYIMGLVK
ncbi:MAG: Uracil-DNA glycosylase [Candidatus Woesebacteria bacterium GW2011_GWA1_33_30]|uniref:Type-4 uracil-DNA glycosylase n=1 Tax=Candidatus Woesebacteria bacterium GW2011_GWA2_33_28 TaxID=1618561 RepID=A0A0F9ZTR5_9BACT|nr:MAG: Uracil-DNA glycosylase [Candidatus Woesebacteria bacterium GW2011_GWA2_33_28]KKP48531.1 MAG: Uracil-DNA glycosylase [Candidatus Woesebacteria bacterium GW2011_GWA1_33_30]KKP49670.1 MAG: Uracil-DNA glycosylase [Microgenomates group bacterium GW2011_GWC1_33_32]KKP52287.1 MAG: Uracil-DNA glycosylase [Candidatus Woesebacteria bacterium GW2011_GWB1_33_38]KKP58118.1 MAG: Uracil-DNA glycosylase [Microgenomates group bacterium GW2011_GWD1_33_9]